jgi:hypothetical protein
MIELRRLGESYGDVILRLVESEARGASRRAVTGRRSPQEGRPQPPQAAPPRPPARHHRKRQRGRSLR